MRALGLRFENKDGNRLEEAGIGEWDSVEISWVDSFHQTRSIHTISRDEAASLVLRLISSFLRTVRQ